MQARLSASSAGSAAGQGPDLEGDFDYALTMKGFANGFVVGEATFSDVARTAGVMCAAPGNSDGMGAV